MLLILNFLKNENLFLKKECRFSFETTALENVAFPYKTAQSKTNLMTNGMGSIKRTYHEERGFATNYFIV